MAVLESKLASISDDQLWALFEKGDELGLKMELTDAGITWEAFPGFRHQELAVNIYNAIALSPGEQGCDCVRAHDVYIRFPNGLVKRPDLSIFCRRPEQEEGFIYAIPEAVIEITSPHYETKDLVTGPPIYLQNGVKDVIVLDRAAETVHHWTPGGVTHHGSPVVITLTCGCLVTI